MENVETKKDSNVEMKKDWRPIIIYILGQLLVPIVIGFIMGAVVGPENIDQNQLGGYATIGAFTVIFICFIIMYFKKLKEDVKKLTKKNILFIIISAIVILFVNMGIATIFENFNVAMDNQEFVSDILNDYKIPMAIATAFFAPFIEEMVFRYSISTIVKNKIAFVIISSILFGLVHGIGIATLLYIVIGIGFSLIYLKTEKNIASSTIAHIINNLVGIIQIFIM